MCIICDNIEYNNLQNLLNIVVNNQMQNGGNKNKLSKKSLKK